MPVAAKGLNSSPACPAVQGLLIVARDQPALFQALQEAFGGSSQVVVILDRRLANRRQQGLPVPVDRRRRERRSLPRAEEDLQLRQYILVRPQARRPKDWRLTPDR